MEISSKFVGMSLKTLASTITWRQTMNYAAAVGDSNPRYFHDETPEGIIAPPMLAVALTWQISGRISEYLQAENFPWELLLTQVHYTEHLEFHRPIMPGERLFIRGKVAAMIPRKAGTLIVLKFDARDAADHPVFTEHIGGMMRGVSCPDGGAGAEDIPSVSASPLSDTVIWEARLFVDPLAPFIYDGCTDIHFPIHTSRKFASDVGLPGIIHQGTATLAYAARELVNRETGGNPALLKTLACRFTGMVMPGSDIRIHLTGRQTTDSGVLVYFEVLNAEGKKAISAGSALLAKAP
jgi:acyl dehydratase